MSTKPQNGELHSLELEVSGSERKLVKALLSFVKLTDSVQRIRVEIDSTQPIADDIALGSLTQSPSKVEPEQEPETTDEPEQEPETTDEPEQEPETTEEHVCPGCGKDCKTPGGLGSHKKSCDELNDDESESESESESEPQSAEELTQRLLEDEEEGRPPLELLDEYEADEVAYEFLNRFTPEEREELSTADLRSLTGMPLNSDTQKFYVAGMIKVVPGQIRAGDLADLFDDPEYMWQMSYSSVSSNLTLLKQGGVLVYNPEQRTYDLTALGERYVDAVIQETPGYAIRGARDVPKPDRREKSYTVS